jgi:hypothetical protein
MSNFPGPDLPNLPPELEWKDGLLVYRGKVPFDELPIPEPPHSEDFDWACKNPDVQQRYHGLIVVVSNRRVWGAGRKYDEAWVDAQKKPDCPPINEVVFVPISGHVPDGNSRGQDNPA